MKLMITRRLFFRKLLITESIKIIEENQNILDDHGFDTWLTISTMNNNWILGIWRDIQSIEQTKLSAETKKKNVCPEE
jgi:hypothetical protein